MNLSPRTMAALTAGFLDPGQRARAEAVLADYAAESGAEERVLLCIVALAEGDLARLRHAVEVARKDVRDVLSWVDPGDTRFR